MFPRNFVHSAYCIMHGSRRQIMHYQFTLFDHFLYKYGTYHAMMRPKYLFIGSDLGYEHPPVLSCSPCPILQCTIVDAPPALMSIANIPISSIVLFPSQVLSCTYERTYLSYRTSLSSLRGLAHKPLRQVLSYQAHMSTTRLMSYHSFLTLPLSPMAKPSSLKETTRKPCQKPTPQLSKTFATMCAQCHRKSHSCDLSGRA